MCGGLSNSNKNRDYLDTLKKTVKYPILLGTLQVK